MISQWLSKNQISPHKAEMIRNLAKHLFLKPDQINVKATRGEGLGFVGRGEGVICYAVAMLDKR